MRWTYTGLKLCYTSVDHLSWQLFILGTFLQKRFKFEAQESKWYIRSNQAFAWLCDISKSDSKWFLGFLCYLPLQLYKTLNTCCPFRWHLNVLRFCLKSPSNTVVECFQSKSLQVWASKVKNTTQNTLQVWLFHIKDRYTAGVG